MRLPVKTRPSAARARMRTVKPPRGSPRRSTGAVMRLPCSVLTSLPLTVIVAETRCAWCVRMRMMNFRLLEQIAPLRCFFFLPAAAPLTPTVPAPAPDALVLPALVLPPPPEPPLPMEPPLLLEVCTVTGTPFDVVGEPVESVGNDQEPA